MLRSGKRGDLPPLLTHHVGSQDDLSTQERESTRPEVPLYLLNLLDRKVSTLEPYEAGKNK